MIATLLEIEGPQHIPPGGSLLVQQLEAYHDKYDIVGVNHTDIEYIISPSILGLKALDIDPGPPPVPHGGSVRS